MSEYNENFQVLNGVLHVRLSGKFPIELLHKGKNVFQPLIDACSHFGCKKALVDARDIQADLGTTALFQTGEDAAFLSHIGLRVALLAREDMLDRFFEDVAYNRGALLGVFTDMSAACEWLQK
ncbi:hypothetical protein JW935_20740 [candidate division KSB1 bacterium]|nr:hypothetical protein [candidate division KSB1 bacterium]